jgi:hypothetical protein
MERPIHPADVRVQDLKPMTRRRKLTAEMLGTAALLLAAIVGSGPF